MKIAAPRSLKFLKLKRRLGIPHWQVVGLLESLWLFTQTNAAAGDIGRHSDEDIAAGIEWAGDPTELVQALIGCGWLDRCETHRLIVHDWKDHAPNHLKGNLAKNGIPFAEDAANSSLPSNDVGSDVGNDVSSDPRKDHPNLSLPYLSSPSERERRKRAPAEEEKRQSDRPEFVPPTLDEVRAYCAERGKGVDPQKWFDHYTANGWRVGKTAMVDWRASVRIWEVNGVGNGRPAEREPPGSAGKSTVEMIREAQQRRKEST